MSSERDPYAKATEPGTVRLERLLPGPIERIWEYLTDPAKRAQWFAGGPMELRPGGKLELRFDHTQITPEPTPERFQKHQGMTIPGTVTRCEPPRLLAYTWPMDETDKSEIAFELTPQGDQVLLTLTHRRLADLDSMTDVAGGWHLHANMLEDLLNNRPPGPFWSTHAQLEADYKKRFTDKDAPAG